MDENKYIAKIDPHLQIELHSREITNLLGDAPAWLIHTGSYLLYGVLTLLLLGAALISYPDAVRGQVVIEDLANVSYVKASSDGQIEMFFVENNTIVKRGDTIGVIQNGANLDDVKTFCRILSNVERYYLTNNTDLLRAFPFDLIMGDMSDAYENFTQAVRTCMIYNDNNYYIQRKAFLQKEQNILKQESLKNELAILKVEREIFELMVYHKQNVEKNREQLELAYENMVNSIRSWESKYLIRSHSNGRILLGEIRTLMRIVNKGDTICSIISNNQEKFVARMQLEQEKIAGVESGHPVNINLTKYPSHTYGILTGEVAAISFIPYNKMYLVDITFPQRLRTTTQKEIRYELGLQGEAEIITSSRSVLSRIFGPIYTIVRRRNFEIENSN